MKIHFLGTGGAFTDYNFHTNFLLEENSKYFLLDAGSDVRFSLRGIGKSYKDVDSLYVSHLHGDHVYGCEYLGFISYFDPNKDKIKMYGHGTVINRAWEECLRGSMGSLQMKVATLDTYFDVNPVLANGNFVWEGLTCTPFQSIHVFDGFSLVPSFGLKVELPTKESIYFTTDTQSAPAQLMDMYKSVDFIVQDCETSPYKSGVHANYMDLAELPADIKAKMALTHFADNVIDDNGKITEEWANKAKADGFYGFIERKTVIDTDHLFMNMESVR